MSETIAVPVGSELVPPVRVLVLCGSLREGSSTRALAELAVLQLKGLGAEPHLFDARELPLHGSVPEHAAARELGRLCLWSEAHVWCSPELHGAITGVFKNQLDWLPLVIDGVPTTEHKPVALLQVTGGGQSFNALNEMRLIARHLHMLAVPRQFTLARAQRQLKSGELEDEDQARRLVSVLSELCTLTRRMRAEVSLPPTA